MANKYFDGDEFDGYTYKACFTKGFDSDYLKRAGNYDKWEARIIQFDTDDKFWNELIEFSEGAIDNVIGCTNGKFWTKVKLFDKSSKSYYEVIAFEGDLLLKRNYGNRKDRFSVIHKDDIRCIYWSYSESNEGWIGIIDTWGVLGRLNQYSRFKKKKNKPASLELMISYSPCTTFSLDCPKPEAPND